MPDVGEDLLTRMFTGPVGRVELCFYSPKAIFGNSDWPGASGSLLVSSPEILPAQFNKKSPLNYLENKKDKNSLFIYKYLILFFFVFQAYQESFLIG